MSTDAKILSVIGIVTALVLIGGVFLLSRSQTTPPEPAISVDNPNLIRPDSYQTATASAKVNLVEFGDYQCPACASAHPIVERVLSDQVNLIFRHFPLPLHKNAVSASIAAEAAGLQGKYFAMHALLYEDQKAWAELPNPKEQFLKYAAQLKLDTTKFLADLDDPKLKDKVERDRQDGVTLGVNSTPTFFINGQRIIGIPSFEAFNQLIQQLLTK